MRPLSIGCFLLWRGSVWVPKYQRQCRNRVVDRIWITSDSLYYWYRFRGGLCDFSRHQSLFESWNLSTIARWHGFRCRSYPLWPSKACRNFGWNRSESPRDSSRYAYKIWITTSLGVHHDLQILQPNWPCVSANSTFPLNLKMTWYPSLTLTNISGTSTNLLFPGSKDLSSWTAAI